MGLASAAVAAGFPSSGNTYCEPATVVMIPCARQAIGKNNRPNFFMTEIFGNADIAQTVDPAGAVRPPAGRLRIHQSGSGGHSPSYSLLVDRVYIALHTYR